MKQDVSLPEEVVQPLCSSVGDKWQCPWLWWSPKNQSKLAPHTLAQRLLGAS